MLHPRPQTTPDFSTEISSNKHTLQGTRSAQKHISHITLPTGSEGVVWGCPRVQEGDIITENRAQM